ncbi:pyocin knob domain-containing protein [Rossellomorea sp. BNER]|uniref:pyocin knob domain-containing protein n=1 Tax=Rossellomorea sp. BNER TaxID=2962031 RepID=UPI003AF20B7F|nr:pyocin knob domain-containing protein [Rossellomorea sp. BNER]
MTITYFPFDSGQGANVSEIQWQKMSDYWMGTGAIQTELNELKVFADSTGMQVKVMSGRAWLKGHFFESDAEEVLSIGASDATNPRKDLVILRVDWNTNRIEQAVLQGVPSASPTAPALTQNTSRWEIDLAEITVNAGVNTITAGDVKDKREYSQHATNRQITVIPEIKDANTSGDAYPIGVTTFATTEGSTGYPVSSLGTVLNIKMGSFRFTQVFYYHGFDAKNAGQWFRHWYNGSWSNWMKSIHLQSPAWITATLQNGFAHQYSGFRYYKDELGNVRVDAIINGGLVNRDTVITVFPAGYRPSSDYTLLSGSEYIDSSGYKSFPINVAKNGYVQQDAVRYSTGFLKISGSFRAEL